MLGRQLLCIDWIRSEVSPSDQGRDGVRLKDLRLHLPPWISDAYQRGGTGSDHQGVAGESTLSASGHISTVAHVKPRPPSTTPPHAASMMTCLFFFTRALFHIASACQTHTGRSGTWHPEASQHNSMLLPVQQIKIEQLTIPNSLRCNATALLF